MRDCERAAIIAELTPPFVIKRPACQTTPLVFCSPHSGCIYPSVFLAASQLDPQKLRKSEDCYVDELFNAAPTFGAPLIAARFPRAYLDVNREAYELDPILFAEPLPKYANTHTMRVIAGLGTIARIVSASEEIYAGHLPLDVALERIERLYKPFHEALRELVEATLQKFGCAILVDCHSMPSTSSFHSAAVRPEFVIGDRFGTSCDRRVTRIVRHALGEIGRQVQLNRPYAGGFITEHYGQPKRNIHALQIEINRSLYLNETTLERSGSFARFQKKTSLFIESIAEQVHAMLSCRDAAE